MMKRISILSLALASAGGFFWLSRNYQLVKVEADQHGSDAVHAGAAPPGESGETDKVRESRRHAAGAVEIERKRRQRLAEVDRAIMNQEDKVEERRKVLATIVRTKGIIYQGNGRPDSYHKLEQERMRLESQITSLLKYDNDQLMVYASGLDLPDNGIRHGYPEYLEAKRELEALHNQGLAAKHPVVLAALGDVNVMKTRLDEGVVNLRATLQAQLDLAIARLESAKPLADQARNDAQDYVDAKRDFEADQMLLQEMKLLRIAETLKD